MGEIIAVPLWKSCRLTLALFAFFAFLLFYALRVNTGFAIVCMVNQTALRQLDHATAITAISTSNNNATSSSNRSTSSSGSPKVSQCAANDGLVSHSSRNTTTVLKRKLDGQLVWDKHTQGLVHGSLFWGYILTNMAGGILATKFGGKRVIGLSLLAASLLTLFVPVVARQDANLFMALRFLTGMTLGFVSPAVQSLWSYWAPPLESSMLRSICFAGAQLGKVLTYPVTALMCEYGLDGGWPTIFYLQGVVGVLWFISWCLFVFDTPRQHPRISKKEKDYIETSLHGIMPTNLETPTKTPWLSIISSTRVWAIIIAHTCSNWGEYTFLTNIPTYLEEVLQFDVKANGFLSSVPYICVWIMISLSSWIADFVRRKGFLSTIMTRKFFSCFGFLVPAIFLVCLSFVGCSEPVTAVALLTLGVAFTGTQYGGGLYMNAGDIAPKYAGVIYGISNTVATIPGFLAPMSIGILTENQTQENWRSVFYISASIYVFGALVFYIFASGDVQSWASSDVEIMVEAEANDDGSSKMTMLKLQNGLGNHDDDDEVIGQTNLNKNQSDSLLDSMSQPSSSNSNNEDSLIEVHDTITSSMSLNGGSKVLFSNNSKDWDSNGELHLDNSISKV